VVEGLGECFGGWGGWVVGVLLVVVVIVVASGSVCRWEGDECEVIVDAVAVLWTGRIIFVSVVFIGIVAPQKVSTRFQAAAAAEPGSVGPLNVRLDCVVVVVIV
jgi:hypothetical protein